MRIQCGNRRRVPILDAAVIDPGERRAIEFQPGIVQTWNVVVDRLRRDGERDIDDAGVLLRLLVGHIGIRRADIRVAGDGGGNAGRRNRWRRR